MAATDSLGPSGSASESWAASALTAAAVLWYVAAAIGQAAFATYVLVFYGGTGAVGNFEAWNKRLMNGIIEGDPLGNAAVVAHLVLAFVITVGGPLQLVPGIRARAPAFHRWNGRAYIATAIVISLGGLYMVWARGVFGGFVNQVAISINAVLIILFALVAVRYAIARDIATHHRWALRLFIAVSGVWFYRVGIMAWILGNGAPVGIGENLDGPFDRFIAFANYLLPLAVLELYFRVRDRAGALGHYAMALLLVALTGVMALGIFGAIAGMWLPRIQSM
jgi:Predicted membrane protein (DUF2306)